MSMAVMMACVCVGMSSCSDDDNNPNQTPSKKVSKLELTLDAQLSNDLKEVAVIDFHVQQTAGNTSNGETLHAHKTNTITVTANGVPATFQLKCSNVSKQTNLTPKSKYQFNIAVKYNIKATFEDGSTTDVRLTSYTEFKDETTYEDVTDADEIIREYLSALKGLLEADFQRTISVEMDKNGNVVGTVTQN